MCSSGIPALLNGRYNVLEDRDIGWVNVIEIRRVWYNRILIQYFESRAIIEPMVLVVLIKFHLVFNSNSDSSIHEYSDLNCHQQSGNYDDNRGRSF